MKIQFWPHTQNYNIASYRLRCLSVINGLNSLGESVSLYKKGDTPDILVLSKRYDEQSIEHALELKKKYNVKIYVDICDNHFYYNRPDPIAINRALTLKKAIQSVDYVIASTTYLADVISKETGGATPIVVAGDLTELPTRSKKIYLLKYFKYYRRYRLLKLQLNKLGTNKERRLVWFGNHGSQFTNGGMNDLHDITSYLEKMNNVRPISLTVVSNNEEKYEALAKQWQFQSFYIQWNKMFFSDILLLHGISIIPIKQNPFTLAKTNNRVTTSLMHGLDVFTDEIGDYLPFSDHIHIEKWDTLSTFENIHLHNSDFFNDKYWKKYNLDIIKKWENIFRFT